jgi:hypothetical protein
MHVEREFAEGNIVIDGLVSGTAVSLFKYPGMEKIHSSVAGFDGKAGFSTDYRGEVRVVARRFGYNIEERRYPLRDRLDVFMRQKKDRSFHGV